MRLGVFTDALAHPSLGEALDWLERSLPDVRDVELGTGGYSDARHCDVAGLLSSARTRDRFVGDLLDRGFQLAALNVSGNPLEQPAHDRSFIQQLRRGGYDGVVSIEHEDPWIPAEDGLIEAAQMLRNAI